jgi:hypothetical protein
MGVMHRRLLTLALAAWPAGRLFAQAQRPRQKIAASQLFEALSARFPLRLAAPGLLQLEVSAPALLLLATRNKIGAALQLELGGPALRDRVRGQVDLLFDLRYEAGDRTLRARNPEVGSLSLPGLAAETADAVESMTRSLLAGIPGEVVLHHFTPRELALPDAMGFEPGRLTVLEDGVEIEFRAKPRP